MSTRNFEEYRAEVLEQLGATAEDLRNESSWRAKVFEALGAEYTDEDTRNFERYRLKVLENLSGGGGGSSDFSTANVTISKGALGEQVDGIITWFSEEDNETYSTVELIDEESLTVKVPLGGDDITVYFSKSAISINGDIETAGDAVFMSKILKAYLITGDCSISFT